MLTAKLEGGVDMEKLLFQLQKSTPKRVVTKVMVRSLEPMKITAQLLAPIGRTLRLTEGIEISKKTRPREQRKSDVEVYCGPTGVSYSIAQEFGTVDHAPQPFMRPAWDQTKTKVLAVFAEEIWDEIYKAIERLERKIARDAAKMKAG